MFVAWCKKKKKDKEIVKQKIAQFTTTIKNNGIP